MSPIAKYVFRNLGTRPFLSTLVFGAMVVVGMTLSGIGAIVTGLWASAKAPGHSNWVVVTSRGARIESDGSLLHEELATITTSQDVTHALAEVVSRNHVVLNGALDFCMLRGVPPEAYELQGAHITQGRMPTAGEPEMVVGEVLHEQFPSLSIGGKLKMVGTEFTVVGLFTAPGFLSGEAWTSREFFLRNPKLEDLTSVYLETPSPEAAKRVAAALSASRAVEVDAHVETEFYAEKIGEFKFLIRGLVLIFILVVIGGVLAATSLLAVFQLRRLSEQAVMRAMGFRSARIAMLILYETQILVLSGGAVGTCISYLVLRDYLVTALAPSMSVIAYRAPLSPKVALLAMAGMFVLGVVGALMPILRMANTQITRGLREE